LGVRSRPGLYPSGGSSSTLREARKFLAVLRRAGASPEAVQRQARRTMLAVEMLWSKAGHVIEDEEGGRP